MKKKESVFSVDKFQTRKLANTSQKQQSFDL